jgi:hypothetical protein
MSDKPTVHVPLSPEILAMFEEMEREQVWLRRIEQLPDPQALSELEAAAPGIDWRSLRIDTAPAIAATIADKLLARAVLTWYEIERQRRENKDAESRFISACDRRLADIRDALAHGAPGIHSIQKEFGFLPVRARVEISAALGAHVVCNLRNGSAEIPHVSEARLQSEQLELVLDPFKSSFTLGGDDVQITLSGGTSRLRLRNATEPDSALHLFLCPRLDLFWDMHAGRRGGGSARKLDLSFASGKGQLLRDEDESLFFAPERVRSFRAMEEATELVSLSLEGDALRAFDLDTWAFLLFIATGYEFRPIESHQGTGERVTSVSLSGSGMHPLVSAHAMRDGDSRARISELFTLIPRLSDAGSFTRAHFRIIAHALLTALRQPIQKSLIDLYSALDTLAQFHPKVPRQRYADDEFHALKKAQTRAVEAAKAAMQGASEQEKTALDLLEKSVQNFRNDFGVVQRVIVLLRESGINYDKKDAAQKAALDLRHRASHNLASIRIGPGDYQATELVQIRDVLLLWARGALLSTMHQALNVPQT